MPGPGGPNERCRGEIPSPVRRPRTAAALWRRPSYRDRTGPSRSSPPVQKCCAEMMSVSVARIQKHRCRTTIAERMVETVSSRGIFEGGRTAVADGMLPASFELGDFVWTWTDEELLFL